MKIRILSAEDVRKALPMKEAIIAMKQAYAQLSDETAVMPLRGRLGLPAGTTLVMPAHLPADGDLAVKIVSVFPDNPQQGLPVVVAAVLALDSQTGLPQALLEGGTLTAIRTGAGAGAATDLLARQESSVVAILGSGAQARTQLEAVCAVRDIAEVRVFSPTATKREAFVAEMAGQGDIPSNVRAVRDAETAVSGADIICAATTSTTPVFPFRVVKPGAHINGVGSYRPDMQELDVATIQNARIFVDSREAVLEEAGEIIIPLQAGEVSEAAIYAEIGELVNGVKNGRSSAEEITFFKSVGVAVQDAAAARVALSNAAALGLGTVAEL